MTVSVAATTSTAPIDGDVAAAPMRPTSAEPTGAPPITVSVVVCAYTLDRWDLLAEAVESVASQGHPARDLVLVIDHNDELLRRAAARWPEHVVVPNRFAQGLSGARNTGVAEATGEVVAFLDDDAAAEPGWLDALAPHFADPIVGGVGGTVTPRWLEPAPTWFPDEFLWVVGCSYRGLPEELAAVRNPIGANMAFRRSVLLEAGGFSEDVGRVGAVPIGCEETELSLRTAALGYVVLYDPAAEVRHAVPKGRGSLRYFVQRCQSEGRSKAVVSRMAKQSRASAAEPGGPGAGSGALATEQRYVAKVLPQGVVAGLARAGAIVLGLAVTSLGYAEGRLRRRTTVRPVDAAPKPIAATGSTGAAA